MSPAARFSDALSAFFFVAASAAGVLGFVFSLLSKPTHLSVAATLVGVMVFSGSMGLVLQLPVQYEKWHARRKDQKNEQP